ncbi:growth-regulating factor 8 isoform X2 [Ziziphus jujuba]|uniref:Growth-regulating factor n=1 Tax=Ziziphus jujuba TaxID=326968 RepID=A0A6P4BBD5_ZIZJJ|nr:growth-regulating factor 8 isoform X2 [Ziziphus jujuba]
MQPNKSFNRNYTMMPCHHQNLPTAGTAEFGLQGCCNGNGDCGPLFFDTSNQLSNSSSITHNINDVVGAGNVLPKTQLHHPNSDIFSFNSSGGGIVNVRAPFFTEAQRQELERQTMIYKYMTTSVPVPPQLLIPTITKTPKSFARMHYSNQVKGSLELGISNSSDPEPWRCRRTDGKKWRCSRDVVPHQKYCERHSHKSRPRSRKPVESQLPPPHFRNIGNNQNSSTIPYTTKPLFANHQSPSPPPFSTSMASSTFLHDQTRCLEWFMKGETEAVVDGSNQDWLKAGLRLDNVNHDCDATMDISEHQYEHTHHRLNDQCSLLLAPKLTPFQEAPNSSGQAQETRHFIDAWSAAAEREQIGEFGNRCSVSSNDKVPVSSLSLSMSGGNGRCAEENENAKMGAIGDMKSQWIMNPVSWLGSPPGGPLAEALCLGVAGSSGCNSGGTISSRSSS